MCLIWNPTELNSLYGTECHKPFYLSVCPDTLTQTIKTKNKASKGRWVILGNNLSQPSLDYFKHSVIGFQLPPCTDIFRHKNVIGIRSKLDQRGKRLLKLNLHQCKDYLRKATHWWLKTKQGSWTICENIKTHRNHFVGPYLTLLGKGWHLS